MLGLGAQKYSDRVLAVHPKVGVLDDIGEERWCQASHRRCDLVQLPGALGGRLGVDVDEGEVLLADGVLGDQGDDGVLHQRRARRAYSGCVDVSAVSITSSMVM